MTSSDNPDAELIALCQRADILGRQYDALFESLGANDEPDEELIRPVQTEQLAVLRQIARTRATSLESIKAKAKTFVGWSLEILCPSNSDPESRMIRSILIDILEA